MRLGRGLGPVEKFWGEQSFPIEHEYEDDPLLLSKGWQTFSVDDQRVNILGFAGQRVSHNYSTLSKLYCTGCVPIEHYLWTLELVFYIILMCHKISSLFIFFSYAKMYKPFVTHGLYETEDLDHDLTQQCIF